MNRRKILKLFGLGAVAGPVAIASGTTPASLIDTVGAAGKPTLPPPPTPPEGYQYVSISSEDGYRRALSRLAHLTDREREFRRLRTSVQTLDPDLAVNRSMALHTKIRLQRDRNYHRSVAEERTWLEAKIAGWLSD